MKPKRKEQLIIEGKHMLDNGEFPEKILLEIKERRLRDEISREIFRLPQEVRLDELPPNKKVFKKLQLEVKRCFYEILYGPTMIRRVSSMLLIAGLILLVTSSTQVSTNLVYGITATILSLVLIVLSFSRDLLFSFLLPLGVILFVVVIFELVFLGLPDPLLSNISNDGLLEGRRGGSLGLIFNQIVPFLFLTVKLSAGGIVIYINQKKNNYLNTKEKLKKHFLQLVK